MSFNCAVCKHNIACSHRHQGLSTVHYIISNVIESALICNEIDHLSLLQL